MCVNPAAVVSAPTKYHPLDSVTRTAGRYMEGDSAEPLEMGVLATILGDFEPPFQWNSALTFQSPLHLCTLSYVFRKMLFLFFPRQQSLLWDSLMLVPSSASQMMSSRQSWINAPSLRPCFSIVQSRLMTLTMPKVG